MTNVVLLASHGIAEYDDVRMFHDAGFGIFAPGGYENPAEPGESLRPPLPSVPFHADLAAACRRQREEYADHAAAVIDSAKAFMPDEVIEWADVVIVHHFPDRWIPSNWDRLKGKRVIWRTCGQSDPRLERFMAEYVAKGLQVVRYSPAERRYFEKVGAFAGEDALIRFGKYPEDYGGWKGDVRQVVNVAQHDSTPHARDDALNWQFWEEATEGLPTRFAGPHTEQIGGLGALSFPDMLDFLRHSRAYLYTGTQPASYTLGLIEAMLVGIPVASIGPQAWAKWADPELFEGHELVTLASDDPVISNGHLSRLLKDIDTARKVGLLQRERAESLFGITVVAAQWKAFLS